VLPQKMRGRGNHAAATAAVKLTELGPRLTMKLFKVERGVCEGDVMYHALESRTPQQVSAQRAVKAEAEALKRKRREEQEGNVARKVKSPTRTHAAGAVLFCCCCCCCRCLFSRALMGVFIR
jgi:ribosome biogenesis protein SSF1/2